MVRQYLAHSQTADLLARIGDFFVDEVHRLWSIHLSISLPNNFEPPQICCIQHHALVELAKVDDAAFFLYVDLTTFSLATRVMVTICGFSMSACFRYFEVLNSDVFI